MIYSKKELVERIRKNFIERGFKNDGEYKLKKVKGEGTEYLESDLGHVAFITQKKNINCIDFFYCSKVFEQADAFFDWNEEEKKFFFSITIYAKEDEDGVKECIMFEYISKDGDTLQTMYDIYRKKIKYIEEHYPQLGNAFIKNFISLFTID